MVTAAASPADFYELVPESGEIRFNLHAGQHEALYAPERFVAVIAGFQSGKTVIGPLWLHQEILRCGPGDYLAVSPSYPLMQKKMLPEFLRFFEAHFALGSYKAADRIFEFHDGATRVFFGHGDDPESLESATAKAAWLDEPGQKRFRFGSWEAVQRRLAIHRGRCLLTTTPYDMGWLKSEVYDRWKQGEPDYRVVNFASTMNPIFPKEEDERAQRELPPWKYRMLFRGLFERPAGMIYDCFDTALHVCKPFALTYDWKRYLGLDFGGVNTAAVFIARDPGNQNLYLYREYHAGSRTAKQHAEALLVDEPGMPMCAGGSKSEGQWRSEFSASGLLINEPSVADVEVGINRVYKLLQTGRLRVFNTCHRIIDQLGSYSRVTNERGEPTEKIADKEMYHQADALRYLAIMLDDQIRLGSAKIHTGSTTPPGHPSFKTLPSAAFGGRKATFRKV
jgi:hypothetical protein